MMTTSRAKARCQSAVLRRVGIDGEGKIKLGIAEVVGMREVAGARCAIGIDRSGREIRRWGATVSQRALCLFAFAVASRGSQVAGRRSRGGGWKKM